MTRGKNAWSKFNRYPCSKFRRYEHIGALTRQRARKGVFITTSDFSAGAWEAALGLDIKVVLIDGIELARLMVENNIGCSIKQVYEVKQIDTDYFSEE